MRSVFCIKKYKFRKDMSTGFKRVCLNLTPLQGTPRSHVVGNSNMADPAICKSSATLAPLNLSFLKRFFLYYGVLKKHVIVY